MLSISICEDTCPSISGMEGRNKIIINGERIEVDRRYIESRLYRHIHADYIFVNLNGETPYGDRYSIVELLTSLIFIGIKVELC